MSSAARSGTGRQPGAPVTGLTIDRGQSDPTRWPYTVPAVRHVYDSGLALAPGATVLIGANGAGKSTLVEAIAASWARRITAFRQDWLQRSIAEPADEDSDLHRSLRLACTRGGPTGGLFLRAERLHAQADQFSARGRWSERIDGPLLGRSHGEGFLQVLAGMVAEPGLYVLDEPESALSFDSSLMLLTILQDMLAAGSQVVMATHSPVLAALPGAALLQLDERGITPVDYDDCDLVTSWRAFLRRPDAFLRHLR
ncbi:Predicted ATPase [Blastococcus fimeti]|nr:Predicted ATPase [Blastococcus fimeti]